MIKPIIITIDHHRHRCDSLYPTHICTNNKRNINAEIIKSFKKHLNKSISKRFKIHIHSSNIIIELVQINNKIISVQNKTVQMNEKKSN